MGWLGRATSENVPYARRHPLSMSTGRDTGLRAFTVASASAMMLLLLLLLLL
jgi:hypothetical protein